MPGSPTRCRRQSTTTDTPGTGEDGGMLMLRATALGIARALEGIGDSGAPALLWAGIAASEPEVEIMISERVMD